MRRNKELSHAGAARVASLPSSLEPRLSSGTPNVLTLRRLQEKNKPAIHSWLYLMAKHMNDRLQGTLDLLILMALARSGSLHGYAIAQRIHQATDDSLRIEEGSLYPALQRMTHEKWLRAQWGTTDTGRKARFYTITPAGRRQLEDEERRWVLLTDAVGKALRFA